MSREGLAVVVLAAGQGARMKSDLPKVLHPLGGRPMLRWVLDAVAALGPAEVVVVVGADQPQVAEAATPHRTAVQDPPLGTGHAVIAALAELGLEEARDAMAFDEVLVVNGDTPLLRPETLKRLIALRRDAEAPPALAGLAFRPADPGHYGRFLLEEDGRVRRIVEAADAGPAEKAVDLCNAGPLLADARQLGALLARCGRDNAKGEIYLTDVYALAHEAGLEARVLEADAEEVQGVNSRADLAVAEALLQTRLRGQAMAAGATLIDPSTVWFSADTVLGRDVTIEPCVFLGPGVVLGDGVTVHAFCHIVGAHIEAGAEIGPFARFRPQSVLGPGVRIGNFVEVKNSRLGPGTKANHLSYLGDSEVGAKVNIGAGTIVANYDGFAKHKTSIGDGVSTGSNSVLVAPITVGAGSIVGALSAITRDVPPDSVAAERAQQTVSEGAAKRYRGRSPAASGKTSDKRRKEG